MILKGTTFSASKLGAAGFCIRRVLALEGGAKHGEPAVIGTCHTLGQPRKPERPSLYHVPQGPSWLSYGQSQSSGAGFRPQRPDMTRLQEVVGFQ